MPKLVVCRKWNSPVSAAQRQRNLCQKLKNEGKYDDYKTKQALYMKQYRAAKKAKINDLQMEEKLKKTEEKRLKEKLRKRIYQEKKRASVSSPKRGPGFSSVQGLSCAKNRVKKVLPSSP